MLLTPKPDHHCSWSYASEDAPGDSDSRSGRESADIESAVLLERHQSLRELLHLRAIQPKFIREIADSSRKIRGTAALPLPLEAEAHAPLARASRKSTAAASLLNVAAASDGRWRSDENLGAVSSSDSEEPNEENNLLQALQLGHAGPHARQLARKATSGARKDSALPTTNTSCNTSCGST